VTDQIPQRNEDIKGLLEIGGLVIAASF